MVQAKHPVTGALVSSRWNPLSKVLRGRASAPFFFIISIAQVVMAPLVGSKQGAIEGQGWQFMGQVRSRAINGFQWRACHCHWHVCNGIHPFAKL